MRNQTSVEGIDWRDSKNISKKIMDNYSSVIGVFEKLGDEKSIEVNEKIWEWG